MTWEELSSQPQIDKEIPNKRYTGSINLYAERKRAWVEALRWAASAADDVEVAECGSGFMRADDGQGTIGNYERILRAEADRIEQL